MFHYSAYGLSIHSELALPELLPGTERADVTISLAQADAVELLPARPQPDEVLLHSGEAGDFLIRQGREVQIIPTPDVTAPVLRSYVLGTVIAVLLYQRGLLAIHASAVEIQGGCVGFMGESGWGKSSLAAAFHTRGHEVVADDLLALDLVSGGPRAQPGFPRLKLYPDAADAAGFTTERLVELHPDEEKRGHLLSTGFASRELTVHALYVLAYGDERRIDRLRPQEALIEIIRHSYPTRLNVPGDAAHLRKCSKLIQSTPIYRLTRPQALPALEDLARFVAAHIREDTVVVTLL